MDAITAHVFALFGLCTTPATRAAFARAVLRCPDRGRNTVHRRIKSRLCLPHPAGGVQISACPLCTEASMQASRSAVNAVQKLPATDAVSFAARLGFCPSVLMRTLRRIAGIYRPARSEREE